MEVPLYNSPQVAPAGLPNAQIQGLSPRQLMQGEIAGHEQEQAGQAALNTATNNIDAQAKANIQANLTLITAAKNKTMTRGQDLTWGQDGYLNQKGEAALKPDDQGRSLWDNYNQKMQDAIGEASAGLTNDAQREAFNEWASQYSTQFRGDVQKHAAQENQSYGLQTQQGAVDIASDTARRNWFDPNALSNDPTDNAQSTILRNVADAKAAAYQYGIQSGQPANLIAAKQLEVTSNIHAGVIASALQNNRTGYAQQYLDKFSSEMTAGDILKSNGMITSDMQARVATGTAQQIMDGYRSAFQPTDSDRVLQITKQAESGGRDFNADGTPLTSPKGAKYAMQVTPETAANPGYGIKPAENDSPEAYNRVGVLKLGAMVQKYKGDMAKTWAAYNWGEGNVDAAIKKDGVKWLQNAPQETQNYVANNMKQLQAGGGVQPMPTLQDIHQKARDALGPNADPQTVAKTLQAVTQMYSDQVKANQQQADQTVTKALQYLAQNNGDFNSLPPDIHAAIVQQAPDQLPKLMEYGNAIANPPKISNMAAYHEAFDRPDLLAKMSDSQFTQFAMTNFNPSDQKQLAKIRQDAISGKVDTGPATLNEPVFKRELTNRMQAVGLLDPHGKPLDPDQAGTLSNYLRNNALAVQQQTGQKMTESDLIKYIDSQFLKSTAIPGMLYGTNPKATFAMRAGDIPSADLSQIKDALAKQGNTSPSNDQILRTYWTAKAR